jgi:hypothetical protein
VSVCSVPHGLPLWLSGPVEHPLDHAQAQGMNAVPLVVHGLDDRVQRQGGLATRRILSPGEADKVREADKESLT